MTAGRKEFSLSRAGFPAEADTFAGSIIALNSDGAWLAQQGSSVTIWDTAARRPLLILPPERSTPWSFAWSPDRKLLAIGSTDGGLVIWNFPEIRSQLATIDLAW